MHLDLLGERVSAQGAEINALQEMLYSSDRKSKGGKDFWRPIDYPEDEVRTLNGAAFHGVLSVIYKTVRHELEVSDSTLKIARSSVRQLVIQAREISQAGNVTNQES